MAPEADEHVPHEAEVEEVIREELQDVSTHGPIADLAAPSSSYVQAEAAASRAAVNGILAVLRDAKLIPTT